MDFRFMSGGLKTSTFRNILSGLLRLVLTGHVYLNKWGAKYLGKEKWSYVTVRPGAYLFYWLYHTYHPDGYLNRPLVLWLQGGPGGSSSGYGNFDIIGPLTTNQKYRETTWVNQANILFVDQPVGTGFSYVDNSTLYTTTTQEIVDDLYVLMKVFYQHNPEFRKIPVYIFGQSYGGKMAAVLAHHLNTKIKNGDIKMTLAGFAMGNSWIHPVDSTTSWGELLYIMSNVDEKGRDEIDEVARQCKEATEAGNWERAKELWSLTESVIWKLTNGIDFYNVLKYRPSVSEGKRRRMLNDEILNADRVPKHIVDLHLRSETASLHEIMNGKVKDKLRIIPENVTWTLFSYRVFSEQADDFMKPVVHSIGDILENTNLTVVVYQGQLDLICPTNGAMKWVSRLKDYWKDYSHFYNSSRTWLVSPETRQTDTFVKAYKNFKFYWNLKAGHAVPKDDPMGAYRMLQRILADTDI